jgi:hypothetical protein
MATGAATTTPAALPTEDARPVVAPMITSPTPTLESVRTCPPRKLPTDDLNDLRAFCKLAVVQDVAGVQLGEVENRDVRLAQIASVRLLVRINCPQPD